MSRTYIKARSWHVVRRVEALSWVTVCGRVMPTDAPVATELELDEKSCETCLRLTAADILASVLVDEAVDATPDDAA